MTLQFKRHSKSRPAWPALLFACFSVMAVLLAAYGILLAGAVMRERTALNRLQYSLRAEQYEQSQATFQAAVNRPFYAGWLGVDNGLTQTEITRRIASATDLLNLHRLLQSASFDEALALFERIGKDELGAEIIKAGLGEVPRTIPEEMMSNLKLLAEHKDEIAEYDELIAKTRKSLESLAEAQRIVAGQFADFFSLKTDDRKDVFEVYSSGEMKDLPILLGLPDGIKDLKTLKRQLNYLGGRVRTRSNNPHREFQQTIATLRDDSLSNLLEARRLQERIEESSARIGELSRGREKAITRLSKDILETLKILGRPRGQFFVLNALQIEA